MNIDLAFLFDCCYKFATVVIAVVVAVYGIKYNNNLKNSRILEVRQIKEQYYHKLLECFIKHFSYVQTNNEQAKQSEEAARYNMEFCIETSRLALYASKEIILYFSECQKDSKQFNISHLIYLIQKDLEANREKLDILGKKELERLPIMVPDKVIVTNDAKKMVVDRE